MSTPPSPQAPCARCGGDFHCGVNDVTPCACSTLVLPPALQAQLRQQFTGCLCMACLRDLVAQAEAAP